MPRRILIVDDHEAVLFALWDYLTVRRYTVDRAANRAEAERLLARHAYAVVITDLSQTRRDGTENFEVVRVVQERSPATRMIMLTAHGSPEIEAEARRLGAHVVLLKPLPLARLANVVARLLRKRPTPAAPPEERS